MSDVKAPSELTASELPLERDVFLRTLLRHLSGTLEEVIGLEEASGFISVVGQEMGEQIGAMYRKALQVDALSPDQIGAVFVDLKRRIQGDFYILHQDEEKIVLGNRACPFGAKVEGRPALCMMTSNVFGSIAARDTGYAKVELNETIAQGAAGCVVTVYLKRTPEAEEAPGRQYFRGIEIE